MHQSSYNKMKELLSEYVLGQGLVKGSVLDFGSYNVNGTYRELLNPDDWEYLGLDMNPGPGVDLVPEDTYKWNEIPDESFDLIVSGQAFEHCEYFWLVFEEFARILKPSGKCIIIAPSSGHEHRFPVDCWRFYPDGMRALCKYVGFEVLYAETNWDPVEVDEDDSHLWKDTALVAEKP